VKLELHRSNVRDDGFNFKQLLLGLQLDARYVVVFCAKILLGQSTEAVWLQAYAFELRLSDRLQQALPHFRLAQGLEAMPSLVSIVERPLLRAIWRVFLRLCGAFSARPGRLRLHLCHLLVLQRLKESVVS
jgi:hypothetical protein